MGTRLLPLRNPVGAARGLLWKTPLFFGEPTGIGPTPMVRLELAAVPTRGGPAMQANYDRARGRYA